MTRLVSTAKGIGRLEDDGLTVAVIDHDAPDLGAALQAGIDVATLGSAAVRERVTIENTTLLATVPRPRRFGPSDSPTPNTAARLATRVQPTTPSSS